MRDLSKNLKEFNQVLEAAYKNVLSVIVYQNDKKIFENYYERGQIKPHSYERMAIMSCNKSIISALAGIAINMGYIRDVNQHILDFFPEYLHKDSDPNILRIRIKHLLTMTSGFYYLRLAGDSQPVAARAKQYDDEIKYILDLPIENPDLSTFQYNNFDASLMSAIVEKSSGMKIDEFANKYLFSKIGINAVDDIGVITTEEMARFGLLYLHKGNWNGEQIIPEYWVEQSAKNYGNGYGYMWWIQDDNMYMAFGAGGSMIMVIPNENAVVVSHCKNLKLGWRSPREAVREYLFKE